MVRIGTIEVERLNIFYREAGKPGNPKLVLLHGWPASSHQYRSLIPALADKFHVISMDYPGFGNSDMPDPTKYPYTFDKTSEVVEAFLKKKDFNRFGIFMQDYGGPVGFRILLRNPGLLEKMMRENQEGRNHMDAKVRSKKGQAEQVFITRDFDAPCSLVIKAWTDCGRLMSWWGPKGFTTPLCNIDLRPKGVFHHCMRSPEGKDYCGKGVYREIVEPERIIYTDFFVDEKGNPVPPSHYGISPDWPQETLVTVTFAEHDGKTRLALQHSIGSVPESERDMCQQGWTEMLEKLAEEVAKA